MTTLPMARGWYQHEDDPHGVQRWFDGSSWTSRTTGRPRPALDNAPVSTANASAAVVETTHTVTQNPSLPAAPPGWYACPGDAAGMQRWYDGVRWTERVTSIQPITTASLTPAASPAPAPAVSVEPDTDTYVAPPATRGWHTRPGDPPGVQRWYDGTQWTDRLTGGTLVQQANARAAAAGSPAALPAGFMPMLYNPTTGQTAHVNQRTGTIQIQQRYGAGRRLFYCGLWTFYTVILTISGFGLLSGGQVIAGLLSLALACLTGHYVYRIWTYRARRLLLLIFF